VRESSGVVEQGEPQNPKLQAPNLRALGVRFQVSGKRNRKPETCWSEAEIPSEAKRQRETLNTET